MLGMDYLGYQSVRREMCVRSHSPNESCNRGWQVSTSHHADIHILPVTFADFMNAFRKMLSVFIDVISAARPTSS